VSFQDVLSSGKTACLNNFAIQSSNRNRSKEPDVGHYRGTPPTGSTNRIGNVVPIAFIHAWNLSRDRASSMASYSGRTDDVLIRNSRLTLPHSRLSVDGSIDKQLNIAISTTNLDDLFAALSQAARPQVALRGGQATFKGTVTGSLTAPRISGHLVANRFSVAERQFDNLSADVSATGPRVAIQNGSLERAAMQTKFSGTLGLRDWKTLPNAPLAIHASIQNGDLADLLALAGQPSKAYSGQLSANASIDGTLGNPRGAGSVAVTHGVILGQPFDRAEAQINLTDQLVTVPSAFVQLGAARLNFSGQFKHPRDSFTTGQLRADLKSDRIDLAQLAELQKQRPNTVGAIQLRASVNGNLSGEFQLTNINGNASVRGLQSQGLNYGDLTVTASTSGQRVSYNLTSNFAGANMTASGATDLTRDYPTSASANLANLPVERLLSLANRPDIRITGMLSGTANFSGTANNPTAAADLRLTRGTIYEDFVDRVHARVNYQPQSVDVPQLELVSADRLVCISARATIIQRAISNPEICNSAWTPASSIWPASKRSPPNGQG
jgi:translocation and assembly module TamB